MPKLTPFINYLVHPQYIRIEHCVGMSTEQQTDIVLSKLQCQLKPPRPLASKLEGGSDANLKELLTQNLEEGKVPR